MLRRFIIYWWPRKYPTDRQNTGCFRFQYTISKFAVDGIITQPKYRISFKWLTSFQPTPLLWNPDVLDILQWTLVEPFPTLVPVLTLLLLLWHDSPVSGPSLLNFPSPELEYTSVWQWRFSIMFGRQSTRDSFLLLTAILSIYSTLLILRSRCLF